MIKIMICACIYYIINLLIPIYLLIYFIQYMKIQIIQIVPLFILLIWGLWKLLFPVQQFLESTCIVGDAKLPTPYKIVDCSSCYTFPININQRGHIQVRSGTPQQLKQEYKNQGYQLWAHLYQQQQCKEYECENLSSSKEFETTNVLNEAGLIKVASYSRFIDENVWEISFKYNNNVRNGFTTENLLDNLINYLLGPVVPQPLLPHKNRSYGMALKLRYTQPQNKTNENISKPIVKMSQIVDDKTELICISLIIGFVLTVKLGYLTRTPYQNPFIFVLCLGFISPYLFSLVALLLLVTRHKLHLVSLLIFVFSISIDYPYFILGALWASSFTQFIANKTNSHLCILACFNLIILFAFVIDQSSIYSTTFLSFFALCLPQSKKQYQKIKTKEESRAGIQLKDYQPIIFQQ